MSLYPVPVQTRGTTSSADYIQVLLGKAFERIPGEMYNQYRYEVLERLGGAYMFYELSLMQERSWDYMLERVYPIFVKYVKAKGKNPRTGKGVIVAVFHGESCHLINGEHFLPVLREVEGMDEQTFLRKITDWLSH